MFWKSCGRQEQAEEDGERELQSAMLCKHTVHAKM